LDPLREGFFGGGGGRIHWVKGRKKIEENSLIKKVLILRSSGGWKKVGVGRGVGNCPGQVKGLLGLTGG